MRRIGSALVAALLGAALVGCGVLWPLPVPTTTAVLAANRAKWEANRPTSYAYTYDSPGPGGHPEQAWKKRLVHMGDLFVSQTMRAGLVSPDDSSLTIEQLFADAADLHAFEEAIAAGEEEGEAIVEYEATFGFPTRLRLDWQHAVDEDRDDRVRAFTSTTNLNTTWNRVRTVLERADRNWPARAPADYAYTWHRFGPGAAAPGEVVLDVRVVDGVATVTPRGPAPAAATDPSLEGVLSTAEAALAERGWLDVNVSQEGFVDLVAVDPDANVRDDEWVIRIEEYRDLARDEGAAELEDARTRWANEQPTRYSYTWTYRSAGEHAVYRVRMIGETAEIRLVEGEAPADLGLVPRIDETFELVREYQGARISFDPRWGYPMRIVVGRGDGAVTITVTDFRPD